MKATFENSVDVLVKAYMNDTLHHNSCTACAVGNLIGAALGTEPMEGSHGSGEPFDPRTPEEEFRAFHYKNGYNPGWACVIVSRDDAPRVIQSSYEGSIKDEIDATGYTPSQLARVEYAFESALKGDSDDTWMFNGLMAVVDVLAEIHNVDLSTKQQAVGHFQEVQLSKVGA